MYKHITVNQLSEAFGAEISGIDITNINPEVSDEIVAALNENLFLLFRDQHITPEQHIAFAKNFGVCHLHPIDVGMSTHKEILVFNKNKNERVSWGGAEWHTDQIYNENSAKYTFLYPRKLPDTGGNTGISNGYLAYESLSKEMQDKCDGLKTWNERKKSNEPGISREQDLVRVHPGTNKKYLYISNHHTKKIIGVSEEESIILLDMLKDHVVQEQNITEIEWKLGTLAMIDIRCTQHRGINNYNDEIREMHRVAIADDK